MQGIAVRNMLLIALLHSTMLERVIHMEEMSKRRKQLEEGERGDHSWALTVLNVSV